MSKLLSRRVVIAWGVLLLGAVLYADQSVPGSSAHSAIWAQLKSLEQQHKADLAALDQQIAPLREQVKTVESSLKPLRDKRESLITQYESQRASLRDQVEPGYQSAFQTKEQALSSAKAQHEQAIASANQQFASQRQQINAQFEATVKTLKQL